MLLNPPCPRVQYREPVRCAHKCSVCLKECVTVNHMATANRINADPVPGGNKVVNSHLSKH